MQNIMKKPYEISLWDDVLVFKVFGEPTSKLPEFKVILFALVVEFIIRGLFDLLKLDT